MKSPARKKARTTIRVKPGGVLRIPLFFLYRLGWHSGDKLIIEVTNDQIYLSKQPTEPAWRIERLRQRICSGREKSSSLRSR